MNQILGAGQIAIRCKPVTKYNRSKYVTCLSYSTKLVHTRLVCYYSLYLVLSSMNVDRDDFAIRIYVRRVLNYEESLFAYPQTFGIFSDTSKFIGQSRVYFGRSIITRTKFCVLVWR